MSKEEKLANKVSISVKRMSRYEGDGTAKAFCDVAIGEVYLIKGLTVIHGKNGLFVGMPREQGKDGNWYDTVIPLTKEARQQLSETVLKSYQEDMSS